MQKGEKIYRKLATHFKAYQNCIMSNNTDWQQKHRETIEDIISNHFPSGSGLNSLTHFSFTRSKVNKLVVYTSYHAMNDNGYYDKYIDFTLTIKPSLQFGFDLSIVGNFGKYQDVKEYLYDLYSETLETII